MSSRYAVWIEVEVEVFSSSEKEARERVEAEIFELFESGVSNCSLASMPKAVGVREVIKENTETERTEE